MEGATTSVRTISVLDAVGSALILQLAFFLFSLPLVTAAPAAVALQRQLADLREGRRTSPVTYAREFALAWRQSAALGVLTALVAVGLAAAVPFWYAVPTWFGRVALAAVLFVAGLALGTWLTLLRTAEDQREDRWRAWVRPALALLVSEPLRVLVGVVALLAWFAVLARFPSLLLVGSGLVPALASRLTTLGTPPRAQAIRS